MVTTKIKELCETKHLTDNLRRYNQSTKILTINSEGRYEQF